MIRNGEQPCYERKLHLRSFGNAFLRAPSIASRQSMQHGVMKGKVIVRLRLCLPEQSIGFVEAVWSNIFAAAQHRLDASARSSEHEHVCKV